ncbi:MAG: hypothetical protein WC455_09735 [Dehalococcoidia bacterium]|jgi:hypothetical protein
MKVYDVRVLPLHADHVEIEWCIEDIAPGEAVITVSRSESPEGPWTELDSVPLGDNNYYRDFSIDPTQYLRRLYYKVKCSVTSETTTVSHESDPTTFMIQPIKAALHMVKRLEALLRTVGEPAHFFIRRTWGPRCPVCGRRGGATSTCDVCYGTGVAGGYYTPIFGFIAKSNLNSTRMVYAGVEIPIDSRRMWTTNYPLLKAKDLIVDSMGIRWEIAPGINVTDMKGFPFRQIFTGNRIPSDDATYKLSVPSLYDAVQKRENRGWKQTRDSSKIIPDFSREED